MKKASFALIAIWFCFANIPVTRDNQASASQNTTQTTNGKKERADAAFKVGEAEENKDDFKKAAANFKKAIELDPDNQKNHSKFIQDSLFQAYDFGSKKKEKTKKEDSTQTQKQANLTSEQKEKEEKLAKEQEEEQEKIAEEKRTAAKAVINAKLLKTYDGWIKKHPQKAIFLWGKGEVLASSEKDAEAHEMYLKAIAMDPSCAAAYEGLASDAATAGDVQKQREYAEKALALDPKGASHTFSSYALTYLSTDRAKFRQIVEDRAAKYPEGMQTLLSLVAGNEDSVQEQQTVLEQIYKLYKPKASADAMTELFNLYAKSDPEKALGFAEKMQKDKEEADAQAKAEEKDPSSSKTNKPKAKAKPPYWKTVADFEKSCVDARPLIDQGKYKEAEELLEKHALHVSGEFDALSGIDQTPYELEKAEALAGAGDIQKAYDNLKEKLLPAPNEKLEAVFLSYGTKLGKTPEQVNQDLWQTRESKAKTMEPFDLKEYATDRQMKLADLRGHVVLVNFWFPG
jgi:hypothetical protein